MVGFLQGWDNQRAKKKPADAGRQGKGVWRELNGWRLVVIGLHDLLAEPIAHDISDGEMDVSHGRDEANDTDRMLQSGLAGDIYLADVAIDDYLAVLAKSGKEHLHLLGRRVLRLIEQYPGARKGQAAHVGQRNRLDLLGLERVGELAFAHALLEDVAQRPDVRLKLVFQLARQEAHGLAGLLRRAGNHDAVNLARGECFASLGDGDVGLSRAGGSGREDQAAMVNRSNQAGLVLGLCFQRTHNWANGLVINEAIHVKGLVKLLTPLARLLFVTPFLMCHGIFQ